MAHICIYSRQIQVLEETLPYLWAHVYLQNCIKIEYSITDFLKASQELFALYGWAFLKNL